MSWLASCRMQLKDHHGSHLNRGRRARPRLEGLESRVVLYSASASLWLAPQLITVSFVPDGTNFNGKSSNLTQGVHRGRPGHDQQGDDRGVGAGRAGLAVHPRGPDAVAERSEGRRPGPSRSLPGRASRAADRATTRRRLKVKEVRVEDRRYVVCLNDDEARKDAADRKAIVAALREQLRNGDKSLVGNKGYRRYLARRGRITSIDEAKIKEEARYDGKWVLRTNTDLDAAEVALQYKQLWMVEDWFRSCKSMLQTRPIYHKRDETIRGHVFCSFLALVLRQELQSRLEERGPRVRVGRRDRGPGPAYRSWRWSRTASGSCCGARSKGPAARCSTRPGWRCPRRCDRPPWPLRRRNWILVPRRARKCANCYTTMGCDCILSKTSLCNTQHTNIVPIYSVHEDQRAGLCAACMPFLGGASLSRVLEQLWRATENPREGGELVEALRT